MNSAVARLLRALHDAGAQLTHHGDFDWPGARIAAGAFGRFQARPWRFRAADYLAAVAPHPNGLPPLEGRPSPTISVPAFRRLRRRDVLGGLIHEYEWAA